MVMQSVAADREVGDSVPNAQEIRFYIDRAMQMQQQQNMMDQMSPEEAEQLYAIQCLAE